MTVARNRAVWLPIALTTVFAVSYLVSMRGWLFDAQLYRLSAVGAPAFLVYRALSPIADLAPQALRAFVQIALLIVTTLCWFTAALLPFWSGFRLPGLSLRHTRVLFALFGIVVTAVAWIGLGGWHVDDA